MRKRSSIAGLGLLLGAWFAASAEAASSLRVGSASGSPGEVVTIDVSLAVAAGDVIAGTQNDIGFGDGVAIVRRANGRPDCTVNPAIDKAGSSFGFRPPGCSAETCNAVRALVLSTDNTDPIPDGSVLYSCRVAISPDAASGDRTLALTGVVLSNPVGGTVAPGPGISGTVSVSNGDDPTPTPAPAACPAPRPAPAGPAVYVDDLNLSSAGDASVDVILATGGAAIAGTQNDIGFGEGVVIKRRANGRPDCSVNPEIDKSATSFAFRPPGCTAETCDTVRALVLSTDNTDAIPDGSVLYTCNVTVSAEGGRLPVTGVVLSDPAGAAIPASGRDGEVCVEGSVAPTPTPVPAACADPRPAPAGPAVFVQDQNLAEPGVVPVAVALATGGQAIAGTQNDLGFGEGVVINRRANGRPDCSVNPEIDKSATSFAFRPPGCTAETCNTVRALVLSTDNTNAIPDGSVLYTCNVTVTGAGGVLPVTGVVLSDPAGAAVPATGQDGVICVEGTEPPPSPSVPTFTPTTVVDVPTRTPTGSPTGSPTGTALPGPSSTPTSGTGPTSTPTPLPIARGELVGAPIPAAATPGYVFQVRVQEGKFPRRSDVQIGGELLEVETTPANPTDLPVGTMALTSDAEENRVNLKIVRRGKEGTEPATHGLGSVVTVVRNLIIEDEGGCHVVPNRGSGGTGTLLLPLALLLFVRRRSR